MENTPAKQTFIEIELKKFETEHEITEASLVALAAKYKDLKVNGVDDKEGLKAVESARKELKSERVKIEKASKGMRDSAVKFQKAVIAREKDFVSIIEPEENRLADIEDAIWQEKERLREEAEKKESDRIQNMLDQLNELNYGIDLHTLKGMTDEQFQQTLTEAREAYEETARQMAIELEREKERVRLQEEARKAEEEELARVRAEQEKERKALEEEKAEFLAEQKRIQEYNAEIAAKLKEAEDRLQAEKLEKEEIIKKTYSERKSMLLSLSESIVSFDPPPNLGTMSDGEFGHIYIAYRTKYNERIAEQARIEAEQKAEREKQEAIEAAKALAEMEEERLLAGADKGKFEKLQTILEKNFLNEDVIIWLHFKSKKGKVAAARVKELLRQANQICKDNV